jgi:hypothetical protein
MAAPLGETESAVQLGAATEVAGKKESAGAPPPSAAGVLATSGPKLMPVKTTNAAAIPAAPAAAETLADEILGGRDTSATVSATIKAPVEFLAAAYQVPVSGTDTKEHVNSENLTQLLAYARPLAGAHVVPAHGQKKDALRLPARPRATPDWVSCADGDCPLEASKRQPLGLENGDPTRAAARPEKERELADTELVDEPTTANAGNGDHDADTLTDRDADGDTLVEGDKDAETLVDGDEDAETLREAARDGDRDGVFDADVESDRVKKVEGDFDGENDGDACATARGSREKSTASSAAPRRTRAMAAAKKCTGTFVMTGLVGYAAEGERVD